MAGDVVDNTMEKADLTHTPVELRQRAMPGDKPTSLWGSIAELRSRSARCCSAKQVAGVSICRDLEGFAG